MTEVVRKLDEAGVHVAHLEINEPSLDDVFAEATGYRLEGADNAPSAGDNGDEEPKRNLVEGESDKHDSRNARNSSCAFAEHRYSPDNCTGETIDA